MRPIHKEKFMGCGCGRARSVRTYSAKAKGYKVQAKSIKPKAISKKLAPAPRQFAAAQTKNCTRCNKPMRQVSRYDSQVKKLVKFWMCQNRTCRYKVKV